MTASLLTDQELAELAGAIDARMATLRGEIAAGLRQSDDPTVLQLANHFEETDDAAVASLELATEIAAVERDVQELTALQRARERLRAGTYGECTDCGTAIPLARLRAQPAALRCVPCQNAAERASGAHVPPRL